MLLIDYSKEPKEILVEGVEDISYRLADMADDFNKLKKILGSVDCSELWRDNFETYKSDILMCRLDMNVLLEFVKSL